MNDLEALTVDQRSQLLKTRRRVIESIGKNMDLYGITLSIGYLYGNMYFNTGPVTLDEMSQTMGMSKTSMSTGMRTLYDLKMINKVWEKGSRKDLYEVESDWYQNFSDYFSIKWRKAVEQNKSAMKRSLKEIEEMLAQAEAESKLQDNADAFNATESQQKDPFIELLKSDKQKIEEALAYYRWLDRLIDSFESGEIFDFIPKEQ